MKYVICIQYLLDSNGFKPNKLFMSFELSNFEHLISNEAIAMTCFVITLIAIHLL